MKMNRKASDITFSDFFYLDSESPSGLRWKVFNRAIMPSSQRFPGDVAGFRKAIPGGFDYWRVKCCGGNYAVHRIVWVMARGAIPEGFVVNHINGNTFDNSLDNLELVSQLWNTRRRANPNKNNTSGQHGVSLDTKRDNKRGTEVSYWKAQINCPETRKQLSKSFSHKKYGEAEAKSLAIAWREDKVKQFEKYGYKGA